jgi:hypothetical protein
MPQSKHPAQLTASCRGCRDQRLRRLRSNPIVSCCRAKRRTARCGRFLEPRRSAACGECGWRADGQLEAERSDAVRGGPRAAGEPASRGAVAAERQPGARHQAPGSHARLPAIRERSGTRAGKPGWWPARLAAAVPRSCGHVPHAAVSTHAAAATHASSSAVAMLWACDCGHATACEHASPQPMISQRHQLEQQACGENDVRMMRGHGWCGMGPPHPYPAPPHPLSSRTSRG